jgi:uncharacterized protein (TIGR03382 family)
VLRVQPKGRAWRALLAALSAAGVVALAPSEGRAHFILETPASWRAQDKLGSPQKAPPCGDDGGAAETGEVTAYRTGDTVTITIDETIYHPGHYRVALAVDDRSELPEEPPVTAGDTPCGSVPIDPSPAFPVLADGVLVHTKAFAGPQTFQVKLPDDVTCEKCTLQIIEFMSDHGLNNPGGCFYHHCADISISDTGPTSGGASGSAGGGSGAGGQPNAGAGQGGTTNEGANDDAGDDGCAAAAPRAAPPGLAALAGLALAGALLRRRRQ